MTTFETIMIASGWLSWPIVLLTGIAVILLESQIAKDGDDGFRMRFLQIYGILLISGCILIIFLNTSKFSAIGLIPSMFALNLILFFIVNIFKKHHYRSHRESKDRPSETNIENTDRIKYRFIRWIGLIPLAVILTILASFPIHWMTMILMGISLGETFTKDGVPISLLSLILEQEDLERLLMAFFTPYVFVKSSIWIAPSSKFHVATFAAATISVLIPVSHLFVTHQGYSSENSPALTELKIFLNMIAPIIALLFFIKNSKVVRDAQVDGLTK